MNPDRTLKDASEMEWPHSPSDENSAANLSTNPGVKQKSVVNSDNESSKEESTPPTKKWKEVEWPQEFRPEANDANDSCDTAVDMVRLR